VQNLRFNARIYKKQAIQAAINAYSDLARFKVKDNKKYTSIEITDVDPKFKRVLRDEFANYVLGINKKWI
jgi:hypothetical protein